MKVVTHKSEREGESESCDFCPQKCDKVSDFKFSTPGFTQCVYVCVLCSELCTYLTTRVNVCVCVLTEHAAETC